MWTKSLFLLLEVLLLVNSSRGEWLRTKHKRHVFGFPGSTLQRVFANRDPNRSLASIFLNKDNVGDVEVVYNYRPGPVVQQPVQQPEESQKNGPEIPVYLYKNGWQTPDELESYDSVEDDDDDEEEAPFVTPSAPFRTHSRPEGSNFNILSSFDKAEEFRPNLVSGFDLTGSASQVEETAAMEQFLFKSLPYYQSLRFRPETSIKEFVDLPGVLVKNFKPTLKPITIVEEVKEQQPITAVQEVKLPQVQKTLKPQENLVDFNNAPFTSHSFKILPNYVAPLDFIQAPVTSQINSFDVIPSVVENRFKTTSSTESPKPTLIQNRFKETSTQVPQTSSPSVSFDSFKELPHFDFNPFRANPTRLEKDPQNVFNVVQTSDVLPELSQPSPFFTSPPQQAQSIPLFATETPPFFKQLFTSRPSTESPSQEDIKLPSPHQTNTFQTVNVQIQSVNEDVVEQAKPKKKLIQIRKKLVGNGFKELPHFQNAGDFRRLPPEHFPFDKSITLPIVFQRDNAFRTSVGPDEVRAISQFARQEIDGDDEGVRHVGDIPLDPHAIFDGVGVETKDSYGKKASL